MDIIWKDIVGYKFNYEISNTGKIRNKNTFKILKPQFGENGYLHVRLSNNGIVKIYNLHRLVIRHFSPIDNDIDMQVNHKDGDKTNNCIDNLEWLTPKENTDHAISNGLRNMLGSDNPKSYLSEQSVKQIYDLCWNSNIKQTEIAKMFNTGRVTIFDIKNGRTWNHVTNHRR